MDAGKDKVKRSGAPTINGKTDFKPHEIPQLRYQADFNTNLQLKSTHSHFLKDQLTFKQYKGSTRHTLNSNSNNTQAYKARLMANRISANNLSGTSIADTFSTITSPNALGTNVSYRTKMVSNMMPVDVKGKDNPFKTKSRTQSRGKSNISKAQNVIDSKLGKSEDAYHGRKTTYAISRKFPNICDDHGHFLDVANEDINEESEDDAKSNVTYNIR